MRLLILALSLLALASCGDGTPSSPYLQGSPPRYVNGYYGLDVAIPQGANVCVDDSGPTPSHGFLVILEPGVACGAFNRHHRHINVYVGFELSYEFSNVARLAEAKCGKTLVPPDEVKDIVVPGHAVSVCRDIDFNRDDDGKLLSPSDRTETTAMVLLNGEERPFIDVGLSVSLVTKDAHSSEDMKAFKNLLSGVKLEKKPAQQPA